MTGNVVSPLFLKYEKTEPQHKMVAFSEKFLVLVFGFETKTNIYFDNFSFIYKPRLFGLEFKKRCSKGL